MFLLASLGSAGIDATGGTVTTYDNYKVHSFISTGNSTFTVASGGDVEYLIAGGGAAGGGVIGEVGDVDPGAGGGGAGSVVTGTFTNLAPGTYTITVGTGGTPTSSTGNSGGSSSFNSTTATGGIGGRRDGYGGNSGNGGSGVVIVRAPIDRPLATTTGSPTIITDSQYRIYVWKTVGTYSITF